MPPWRHAGEAPSRWQWERSSGTHERSQANNCGPTCITATAGFYNDNRPGIEATRLLAADPGRPTNVYEQKMMLVRRGVPADHYFLSTVEQIHEILGRGRRPLVIGVYMARVPASIRGHDFLFWHSLWLRRTEWLGATRGVDVLDPNFSVPGGHRPDPQRGHRFYPDHVLRSAFLDNSPRWAIVPDQAKRIVWPQVIVEAGAVIRSEPREGAPRLRRLAVERQCDELAQVDGGAYTFWNGTNWARRRRPAPWVKVRHPDGVTGFVIRPHVSSLRGLREAPAHEAGPRLLQELELKPISDADARTLVEDEVPLAVHQAVDPEAWHGPKEDQQGEQ